MARGHRRLLSDLALTLAIVAFPILALVWRRGLNTPFFAIAADDFHRTLYAWKVTRGRFIPSDLWLPLQFWVEALALYLYPDTLVVPCLVNLAASGGALFCLAGLGRTLRLGRAGLCLTILLAATTPWFVWLSVAGLAEPLFIFFILLAYLGVARWRMRGREWGLWTASLGLLAAGMVRFDGWGHSVAFSLAVAVLWRRRSQPHRWLVAAAIPWIFPLAWLGMQHAKFGHPFWFSKVTRDAWLASYGALDLTTRLTWQIKDLWRVAGVAAPLAIAGIWSLRRQRGINLLFSMGSSSLSLLVVSTLTHTITQASPERLVVAHTLLLAPATALALQKIGQWRRLATAGVVVLVVLLTATRLATLPHYPNGLPDDTGQVGRHVHQLRAERKIQPGERVMFEVIFWDYVILPVLVGDPDIVVYDREPLGAHTFDNALNPSLLTLPADELREALSRQQVRLVVAHSESAVSHLRPIARETLHAGRFYVFILPVTTQPLLIAPVPTEKEKQ